MGMSVRLGGMLVRLRAALVSGFGVVARMGMVALSMMGGCCAMMRGGCLMMAGGLMMRLSRIFVRGILVGLRSSSDMLLVASALTCHN